MAQEALEKVALVLFSNVNRHNFLVVSASGLHRQSTGERTACVVAG